MDLYKRESKQQSPVAPGVFISYRRESGGDIALLLQTRLTEAGYGAFLDCDTLRSGRFNQAILRHIEEAPDFVVVLSKGCLERCKNPGDFVRTEIAHAIRTKRNIIPYFLSDFIFPSEDSLPEEIRELVTYTGVKHSHEFFKASFKKLCEALESEPNKARVQLIPVKRFSRLQTFVIVLLCVVLLASGLYFERKIQIQNSLMAYRDHLKDAMEKAEELVNEHCQAIQRSAGKPESASVEKTLQVYKSALLRCAQDPQFRDIPEGLYVFERTPDPREISTRSEYHFALTENNQRVNLPVSFGTDVWITAPKGSETATNETYLMAILRACGGFEKAYKQEDLKKLIVWQYFALNSGIMCSYPWHKSFNKGYDPRMRDWYQEATSNTGLEQKPVWTVYPSSSNSCKIYTCSRAIYEDGGLCGVVGADIAMESLIKEFKIDSLSDWMRDVQIYHVAIKPHSGQRQLQIVWEGKDADRHTSWNEPYGDQFILEDNPILRDKVVRWIDRGEVNTAGAIVQGRFCFVACSVYQKGKLGVLFVMPWTNFVRW